MHVFACGRRSTDPKHERPVRQRHELRWHCRGCVQRVCVFILLYFVQKMKRKETVHIPMDGYSVIMFGITITAWRADSRSGSVPQRNEWKWSGSVLGLHLCPSGNSSLKHTPSGIIFAISSGCKRRASTSTPSTSLGPGRLNKHKFKLLFSWMRLKLRRFPAKIPMYVLETECRCLRGADYVSGTGGWPSALERT